MSQPWLVLDNQVFDVVELKISSFGLMENGYTTTTTTRRRRFWKSLSTYPSLFRTFLLLPRQKRSSKLWAFRRRVVLALGGLPCDIPEPRRRGTGIQRVFLLRKCWRIQLWVFFLWNQLDPTYNWELMRMEPNMLHDSCAWNFQGLPRVFLLRCRA